MTRPAPTAFRFSQAELDQLDELAEAMGCSRAETVRKLLRDELERRGLGQQAAGRYIGELQATYGSAATLEIVLDGATVEVSIDGAPADLAVFPIFRVDRRADLMLDVPEGGPSLLLATVKPTPGVEIVLRHPLAALTPDLVRPES